ncbi:MAG: homoserine O-succinyltransferase [Chloroflexi bacterium]|nr:homoserine O-succinyltransferase [Chloroflexota bacterium]
MPLVAHTALPTFSRLRQHGEEVLTLEKALAQDIRELHIGLLNMMPDAALEATERQFMRLVGNSNPIAQLYVHPFSLPCLPRGKEAQEYIKKYYTDFERLKADGLDALIITGANVANPSLDQEPFWEALTQVVAWATKKATSTLCSCLATHALLKHLYGIERKPLPQKQWGVYNHRIAFEGHPLLRNINTRFDAPHSRHNEITRAQLEVAGLQVLVESRLAGVHMAVSPDLFRMIYFQGHPEYDIHSLLKEYKREVLRHLNGELDEAPPYPENYFSPEAAAIADAYIEQALAAKKRGHPYPKFPEEQIMPYLDNTWGDTGKAIINNWLGLVYKVTHLKRKKLFMDHINPEDPLRLRQRLAEIVSAKNQLKL